NYVATNIKPGLYRVHVLYQANEEVELDVYIGAGRSTHLSMRLGSRSLAYFRIMPHRHHYTISEDTVGNGLVNFDYYWESNSPDGTLSGIISDEIGDAASFPIDLLYDESGAFKPGAGADYEGRLRISPIEPGYYIATIKYGGMEGKVPLAILPGSVRWLDFQFLPSTGTKILYSSSGQEVMISNFKNPPFEKDQVQGVQLSNRELTAIGTRDVNSMVALAPGVQASDETNPRIRGARLTVRGATAYFVDGQKVRGGVNLPQSAIANLEVVTGGTPAEFGTFEGAQGLIPDFRIRDDWRDWAYWQPLLRTDANGEARFRAVMPSALTAWNSYALATAADGRMAIVKGQIKSVQALAGKLTVPRFLLAGDAVDIRGRALNYTDSAMQVQTAFRRDGDVVSNWSGSLDKVHADTFRLEAANDTLSITYEVEKGAGQGDGERREIPVLPVGMQRRLGTMAYLEGDSTHRFSLVAGADSTCDLLISNSPLDMLLEQLDHLKDYPHACNEQTASKLKALLLKRTVFDSLGRKFEEEAMIKKLASRLVKSQNDDGSWGWWPGGSPRLWITLHVVEALADCDVPQEVIQQGEQYLIDRMDKLSLAKRLSLMQHLAETADDMNVAPMLQTIPDSVYSTLWQRMLRAKLQKTLDLPWKSDSLFAEIDSTDFNHYGWRWYGSSVDMRLLAYELTRENDTLKCSLPRRKLMLDELASYRYNTFQTAKMLAVLVPEFLQKLPKDRAQETRVVIPGMEEPITDFPFRTKIDLAQTGDLNIRKTGLGPLTVSLVQEYWEANPPRADSIFDIRRRWFQHDKLVDTVQAGVALELNVILKVKEFASEVALEIPIPANCFWAEKPARMRGEAHREYQKDRLIIYFDRLYPGTKLFRLKLEPRFSGHFTLNPIQCYPMYEVLRNGNTATQFLRVD
ncbi:MAG: alpha-2-macroglobulin family protein, partial [Bacteroidia bacterium]